MPNKLNELNAIASFGESAKIDGFAVSTYTAKVILKFYSGLPHGLRRNYLSLPIDRMANIAYSKTGANPAGLYFNISPNETNELLPFAREVYRGEEIVRKKYVLPFLERREKEFKKFSKKHKFSKFFV